MLSKTYKCGINFGSFVAWIFLLSVITIGFVASIFSSYGLNTDWYQQLTKAPWQPPNWVFTLVWILLYVLIGLTTYTGVCSDNLGIVFGSLVVIGLLFNGLWTFVYFVMQEVGYPFWIIMALTIIVLIQIIYMLCQNNRPAKITGGLLILYLLWLVYASSLNGYQYFNAKL